MAGIDVDSFGIHCCIEVVENIPHSSRPLTRCVRAYTAQCIVPVANTGRQTNSLATQVP